MLRVNFASGECRRGLSRGGDLEADRREEDGDKITEHDSYVYTLGFLPHSPRGESAD